MVYSGDDDSICSTRGSQVTFCVVRTRQPTVVTITHSHLILIDTGMDLECRRHA